MFTTTQLDTAFNCALSVVNFKGGFDTFKFRKGFEEGALGLCKDDQKEVLDYLKGKMTHSVYRSVKAQIDEQEFLSTDYYASPYPRQFRGAYAPVVYKTFGGVMALSL